MPLPWPTGSRLKRCVVAIASVVADSENHAVDIHRGVSKGAAGRVASFIVYEQQSDARVRLHLVRGLQRAARRDIARHRADRLGWWAGAGAAARHATISKSNAIALETPGRTAQVDDGQRDPMLSRESLEAYRRMTAGQRLALTLQAMRDSVPHLLHGPREDRSPLCLDPQGKRSSQSAHGASAAWWKPTMMGLHACSGCGLRGRTRERTAREEGSVTGMGTGETDRISNRLSSSRYGQWPSVSPRKSGLVDYAEGRQAARLSPGFCASRVFLSVMNDHMTPTVRYKCCAFLD